MRKLALCLMGLILTTSPALAQMGGMGGGGMGGGGMGGRGSEGAGVSQDDDSDQSGHHTPDYQRGLKPISKEKFDKVVASMFALVDINHDGLLTLAELETVIAARRDAVIQARFKELDANHDGHIDLAEFIAWQKAMGSAAASDCAAYAGQTDIVPESIGPDLGDSERDEALAVVIEPISPLTITRANIHYRPGITLDDLLAYENTRFDAADTNQDGYLDQLEINAKAHATQNPADTHGWPHHGG